MNMTDAGLNTRDAAVSLMTAVTEEGIPLAARTTILDRLPAEGRARAQRLATEALRWAQRSDRLLGPHLRNKPEERVMNLFRLALYEIHVERAPPHGPVNDVVSLAPASKKKLLNAVLRNVLRRGASWDDLPLPKLPKWLRRSLVDAWGKGPVASMERVHLAPAPLDLTLRDSEVDRTSIANARLLETGSLRIYDYSRVTALPGFAEGSWWVQDAAAAIPARLLNVTSGERVLDLCAAPGGKTMQMASRGATVTAVDISPSRMARVAENLARTRLDAELVTADALTWEPEQRFDAILLDAPCSATGTFRRHPDLAYTKSPEDVQQLVRLQSALIDRAFGWLRPGGRMVFCTCSLLPDEGEMQLAAALKRHPDLCVSPITENWIDARWHAESGGLRIRPDHWEEVGGIDGFFIALVMKRDT